MENQQILAKYANGWHASDTIGKIAEVMQLKTNNKGERERERKQSRDRKTAKPIENKRIFLV